MTGHYETPGEAREQDYRDRLERCGIDDPTTEFNVTQEQLEARDRAAEKAD